MTVSLPNAHSTCHHGQVGGAHAFAAQTWLRDGILAVATLKGEVLIIRDAEQRAMLKLGQPLHCIAPVGKGFVVGSEDGSLIRFSAADGRARCVIMMHKTGLLINWGG